MNQPLDELEGPGWNNGTDEGDRFCDQGGGRLRNVRSRNGEDRFEHDDRALIVVDRRHAAMMVLAIEMIGFVVF